MLRVNRREHLLLADELVVVLFGLGIEARIVIGIPGLRAGRARIDRLVQAAQASRAGRPRPGVVAVIRIGVAITQQAGAASVLGRELGPEQEQPQLLGLLEIRIAGNGLDFGAAGQVIVGIMPVPLVCDVE
jgi:hypothetical protein